MKKIVVFSIFFLGLLTMVNGQGNFRLGLHVSPSISWMAALSDNMVNSNGSNIGLKVGVMGEVVFGANENYAFETGIGFAFNQGGTLLHTQAGKFLANSELNTPAAAALDVNSDIQYQVQFVEIPVALKLKTREFANRLSYFANIPMFFIGIPTRSRGDITGVPIDAEGSNPTYAPIPGETVEAEKENIGKDVNELNLSWGIGGGVEYSVGSTTTIYAGLYYQDGFLDMTRDKDTFVVDIDEDTGARSKGDQDDSRATINAITLRLGIWF